MLKNDMSMFLSSTFKVHAATDAFSSFQGRGHFVDNPTASLPNFGHHLVCKLELVDGEGLEDLKEFDDSLKIKHNRRRGDKK